MRWSPTHGAATREISAALDSGKHTTTHATLYHLDADSELIDSPGLQEFGLGHLDRQEIEHAFREFRPYLGQCRFRDCRHDREPDCALTCRRRRRQDRRAPLRRLSPHRRHAARRLSAALRLTIGGASQSRAPCPGSVAGGEAGGQQVAAGRRLPVEHLAGAKDARQVAQHQVFVQRLEGDAARRADRLVDRPWRTYRQRQMLDCRRQAVGRGQRLRRAAIRAAGRP